MNLGQTMLTAGMLMLLVVTVISANRMINENTQAQYQTEALTTSASLANDLLLEIMSKKYDTYSDTLGYQSSSSFSAYLGTGWGPNSAERTSCPLPDSSDTDAFKSLNTYNDVDDYDGYSRTTLVTGGLWGQNGVRFHVTVVVFYVNPGTPDTKTTSRTFFKRVAVTVQQDQYLNTGLGNAAVYTALASY
jgi:hypothetical protein